MVTVVNKRNHSTGEYVGRPSILGNPFRMNKESERESVIEKYRVWLKKQIEEHDPLIVSELSRLKAIADAGDLILVCWCAPKRCHAEVIKEILEAT